MGVNSNGDVVVRLVGPGPAAAAGGVGTEFVVPAPDDANWHHFAFTTAPDPHPTIIGDPTSPSVAKVFVDYTQVGGEIKLEMPLAMEGDHLRDYENHVFSGTGFVTLGFSNDTTEAGLSTFWNGDVDELRISDTALSPSEFLGAIPAESFTWNAGTAGDWSDAGSWSPGSGPPDAGDIAIIDSNGTTVVTVSGNETAGTTNISDGTLDVNAGATLTSPISVAGGTVAGDGTVVGTVTNLIGILSPGSNSGGLVNVGDTLWRDTMGEQVTPRSGAAGVPEPSCLLLVLMAWPGLLARRYR